MGGGVFLRGIAQKESYAECPSAEAMLHARGAGHWEVTGHGSPMQKIAEEERLNDDLI